MRFLPIYARAFGPWGAARAADLRTCRAAARTHVTANVKPLC